MRSITLFCEDSFHESLVGALLVRFSQEYRVAVNVSIRSARGGLPRMHGEFKEFLRDLRSESQPLPDLVIVVVDANCIGYVERKRLFENELIHHPQYQGLVIFAIPDPHIERWMLADANAFRQVFGRGCTITTVKCAKDQYKRILRKEIRDSGVDAPLGGQEYAEDIVRMMDLGHVETTEQSLRLFLQNLKGQFNRWRSD